MAFPAIAAAVGGLVGNIGSSMVNYVTQKNFNRQSRADYQKHQKQNFEYSQQAQRNAPMNQVIGMRNAGLSPHALAGSGFAPAAMSGAPQNQTAAPQVDFSSNISELINAMTNRFNAESQRISAEANKQNAESNTQNAQTNRDVGQAAISQKTAETALTNIQVDRATNEDVQYREMIEQLANIGEEKGGLYEALPTYLKSVAVAFANKRKEYNGEGDWKKNYNKGTIQAINDYNLFVTNVAQREADYFKAYLDKDVFETQINSPDIRNAIAKMPQAEFDKLEALTIQIYATLPKIEAETKLMSQQIDESVQRCQKLLIEAQVLENSDFLTLLENDKYWQAAARMLGNAAGELPQLLNGVANFFPAGMAKNVLQQSVKQLRKKRIDTKTRYNKNGQVTSQVQETSYE